MIYNNTNAHYACEMAATATSSMGSNNFKTICAKEDMILRKNVNMKLFSIEYVYKNNSFDLISLINIKLHNLLYEANKDIFESIDIQPLSEAPDNTEYNILYLTGNVRIYLHKEEIFCNYH